MVVAPVGSRDVRLTVLVDPALAGFERERQPAVQTRRRHGNTRTPVGRSAAMVASSSATIGS